MVCPRQTGMFVVSMALLTGGCQTSGDPNVLLPGTAPATVPPPATGSFAVPNQYSGPGQASVVPSIDGYAGQDMRSANGETGSGIRMASFETGGNGTPRIPDDAMPANDLSSQRQFSGSSEQAVRPRLTASSNVELQSVPSRATPQWDESNQSQEQKLPSTAPASASTSDDLRWQAPVKW